jgi:RNA polymerase sigma-70 factor (ECF subfamily)
VGRTLPASTHLNPRLEKARGSSGVDLKSTIISHRLADDLAQETLLKAWQNIDRFEQGTNLRAWLFTILRNTYFSELRKRRREVEDVDGKKTASLSVVPAQQGHLDMQDLREALKLLPAEQREALLVGAAGMSYEEAAEVAQCAVGTIKSRVNRARTKLSGLLGLAETDEFGPDATTVAIVAGQPRRNVNG